MIRQKCQNILLILAFLCVLAGLPALSFFITNNPEPKDEGVPSIDITLNNTEIDAVKTDGKDRVYDGNIVQDSYGKVFSDVSLKGRGNTSWDQPKKSYTISSKKSVSLLGLPPASKWVLIANYQDASMLRNDVSYHIANMLEMANARTGKYFNLYFNGEYEGLYYLTHKISADKTDIYLKDALGVVAEIDMLWTPRELCYFTSKNTCISLKESSSKDGSNLGMEDLKNQFSAFEKAVDARNYNKIKEIVDYDSAIKYYLLSELVLNPDAYATSFYLYKDGPSDKIHFGPGWDFDYALGNRDWSYWNDFPNFHLPTNIMPRKGVTKNGLNKISNIFYDMSEMPEFMDDVKSAFKKYLSGKRDELITYVKNTKEYVKNDAIKDDEKWGRSSFNDEADYLIDWVSERYSFFENLYGD